MPGPESGWMEVPKWAQPKCSQIIPAKSSSQHSGPILLWEASVVHNWPPSLHPDSLSHHYDIKEIKLPFVHSRVGVKAKDTVMLCTVYPSHGLSGLTPLTLSLNHSTQSPGFFCSSLNMLGKLLLRAFAPVILPPWTISTLSSHIVSSLPHPLPIFAKMSLSQGSFPSTLFKTVLTPFWSSQTLSLLLFLP